MSESKKEAIFRRLDKRNEDHQAAKERSREAREEQDESKDALSQLQESIEKLESKIKLELELCNKDQAQSILEELSGEINNLDKFFTEKSPVLAPFDMKKIQAAIVTQRTNYAMLQDALKPRKKFGFKGDKKKAFQAEKSEPTKVEEVKSKTEFKPEEFGFTVKERSNETIEVNNDDVNGQDVMLNRLSNCTVIIKANPITLHATHLTNCILQCGPVQTSIYLDHCNDCKLSLACQQLRAHNSHNSTIFLHVTSKGIIEDCKNIKVAPYDFEYDGLANQFEKLGLDRNTNHWDQLDDFNWLASDQPSPNWSIL